MGRGHEFGETGPLDGVMRCMIEPGLMKANPPEGLRIANLQYTSLLEYRRYFCS